MFPWLSKLLKAKGRIGKLLCHFEKSTPCKIQGFYRAEIDGSLALFNNYKFVVV
jgi:hypothetical protein